MSTMFRGKPRDKLDAHILTWRSKAMLNWVPMCCIVGGQVFWLDAHTMRLGTHEVLWAPITATCGPPKNRQLSRIGSPHPSTKFHALPQQPTRECCVVPRVLCASPRVLRACPSVPIVLCGGAYFCACTPTCVIMCAHVIGQQKIPSPKGRGLSVRGFNPTG